MARKKNSFIDFIKEINEEVNRELEEEKRKKEAYKNIEKKPKNEGGFLGQILTGTFGPFEEIDEPKKAPQKPKKHSSSKKTSPLGDNGDEDAKKRQRAKKQVKEDKKNIAKSKTLAKKKRLRRAIVTAEILGKPVSKRR